MPRVTTPKKSASNKALKLLKSPELREMLMDHFNLSGLLVLDADRCVVYASPKALQALELTTSQLVGEDFARAVPFLDNQGALIPDEKRPSYKALSGTSVQATMFFCQYRQPATGELLPLAVRAAAIRKGKKVLGAIVEIRRTVRQLDVDGMKSLFTGFAAHQLKTPSSIVKGFLELMIRQGRPAYKPEQWHFLTSAFDANERLIRLSQTLLKITRLEGGMVELSITKSNISRILQDRVQVYKRASKERQVSVEFSAEDSAAQVSTDPSFVSEIIDVLVDNALKVMPVGGRLQLSAGVHEGRLEVSVTDQGPGLPEEILTKLRGPIAQHQPGSLTGGNGLGLYMARKYAAMLRGDITAENLSTGGARFTLSVPAEESAF